MARRAAHFIHWGSLFASPPNDALIRALLGLGFEVDVYATTPLDKLVNTERYGPGVRTALFEYGKRWWLKNAVPWKWRPYDLLSGTTEDPIGVTGPLAAMARRPLVVLADEIYSGSYRGDRSERWKRLCRWGMRRAKLTIVNEVERIALQREYAGLAPSAPVLVYPGCYQFPPVPASRDALREQYNIPRDSCVLVSSGAFTSVTGAEWMVRAMRHMPSEVYLWLQPSQQSAVVSMLLDELGDSHRIRFARGWLRMEEAWASMAAADIGLALYHHDGPQFLHMGIASTKLCMYLQMGLPVIVRHQSSFEFLREHDCGVFVESENDLPRAVEKIRGNYDAMSRNARGAIAQHGRMDERFRELTEALARVVN